MIDKKPLIYFCFAQLIGSYSALFLLNRNILGAVLAASFLLIMLTSNKSSVVYILPIFLLIGFIRFYNYYKIEPPTVCKVRFLGTEGLYSIGSYKGRRVILKGDLAQCKLGQQLHVASTFKGIAQYDRGIIGEINIISIRNIESDYITKIYEFKEKLYNSFKKEVGEEAAGELMAVAFGHDSYLSAESKAIMSNLGVIHVVSVSGLHMALIYRICEYILGFGSSVIIALLYCIFTGAASSTVRALIMIIVFKLSKKVYRNYEPFSSLSMAAIIVIFLYPANVLDLGTLLSFLSVLGIFVFYQRFKKLLYRLPVKLNESISLTFSAQVFSLPLCIVAFNSISTALIQGNIFLVPLYSLLMVLGNVSLLFFNIDFIFKRLCLAIKISYTAIEGCKCFLLKASTGILYMSYAEAWILIFMYVSYFLYKKGYKMFLWLPLFSLVFYTVYNFSFTPTFQYVKIGANRGIIYRSGFESVLFLDRKRVKENETLLKKKFEVWKIEDISKAQYFDGHKKLNITSGNSKIQVAYFDGSRDLSIVFTQENIPVISYKKYDIIYLPYDKEAYQYYDCLYNIRLMFHRPIIE